MLITMMVNLTMTFQLYKLKYTVENKTLAQVQKRTLLDHLRMLYSMYGLKFLKLVLQKVQISFYRKKWMCIRAMVTAEKDCFRFLHYDCTSCSVFLFYSIESSALHSVLWILVHAQCNHFKTIYILQYVCQENINFNVIYNEDWPMVDSIEQCTMVVVLFVCESTCSNFFSQTKSPIVYKMEPHRSRINRCHF